MREGKIPKKKVGVGEEGGGSSGKKGLGK